MKQQNYSKALLQIDAFVLSEDDKIAALANVSAILHSTFNFWWTGFYLVKEEGPQEVLVVAPFQGPVACSRIQYGKGVCGNSWEKQKTIIVDNVHEIENHISCSEFSNSEIVVPLIAHSTVVGVLDIDSKEYSNFDKLDQEYLEKVCKILAEKYWA